MLTKRIKTRSSNTLWVEYVYECCGEKKWIRESRYLNVYKNKITTCKSCHLEKMRKNIPPYTEERRIARAEYWKENNPSFKRKNREKISKRMSGDNNPAKDNEIRKKLRLITIEQRKKMFGNHHPMYNPNSIPIIEEFGKKHGYNFQHAENGGEYHIKELGYYVDGYDKEKNVVVEYMEKHHNRQTEKDEQRKQEIIDFLGCKYHEIWE